MLESYKIIKYPLTTEKSVRLMESENKLTFIVDKKSDKPQIKRAVEDLFKVKVSGVNTMIQKGRKKAYVQLSKDSKALDVATQLGLM
ncbi:50S ribosomal protein L23 [Candidatus Woesearchaeota archaeon]|nr:50S ribosomal protein L23 [Candidatus Woesearchaeota archaeon]